MPRKIAPKKQKITVLINGTPITVTLHPPSGVRKSWYAFWTGLTTSKSTGHAELEEAVKAVEDMLQNNGQKSKLSDAVLSDEEFEEIQRRHYAKKKGEAAQEAAAASLASCLEAISAFRDISGVKPIAIATPDDCERFEHAALALPANWRSKHPKKRKDAALLRPATVKKWTTALRAAFERANRNGGRKCVRGVVPESKLLSENPWNKFTGIQAPEAEIRQFDSSELVSFLDFLKEEWSGITVGPLMAKLHLWSASRRKEIAGLRWDSLRMVGDEIHFKTTGKWGVVKWFRVPRSVYRELDALRIDSPFVFGALPEQLRRFHESGSQPWTAKLVKPFSAYNTGRWFYERVAEWSEKSPKGTASTHVFRKTVLQLARRGEDINRQVAADARVTEAVMMSNYVEEADEELRQKSHRIYARIRASLSPELAERYGADTSPRDHLVCEFHRATEAKDWAAVAEIAVKLSEVESQAG